MFAKKTISVLMSFALITAMMAPPLLAQEEDFYDSDSLTEDADGGDYSFEPAAQDPMGEGSEGGAYSEELPMMAPDEFGDSTAPRKKFRLKMGAERDLVPLNAAWGAATGLLLGSWLALISNSDSRTTQRSVGLGIVLGSAMGVAVGMRSIIRPDIQPGTAMEDEDSSENSFTPRLALGDNQVSVGVGFQF
ncbi:MAG: hypothetical protein OEV94_08925 [Deltaproteobacteria bacterium]|nr:hypothetical protein [Deltaproteobacteria bacterium]